MFVVQMMTNDSDSIKQGLQHFYLHHESPHGFIIFIPNFADQTFTPWWGGSSRPPTEHTNEGLDNWILTVICHEKCYVMQLQQMQVHGC